MDIYCSVRCPMWFNLTQHGHQYSLIWFNIAYLPNTPYSLILKIVLWKGFLHCEKGDPNWWLSRGSRQDFFNFGGGGVVGALTHQDGQFCPEIHKVIWLCHSQDICGPNWTVAQSLFWYQDQILVIYCSVRVPMQLNFTQHGHHCGLIWPNIANLPTPLIFRNWKKCDKNIFTLSKGPSQLMFL